MKVPWLILSLLHVAASDPLKPGHVFVYDPASADIATSYPPTVSPETARLILAQRLGVSRYHTIKTPSEEVLHHINEFGGRRQRLFSGSSLNNAHALIWIEDVDWEDLPSIILDPTAYSRDFRISNPPPPSDSNRLIQDIILQAKSLPKSADPMGYTYTAGINVEAELMRFKHADTYNLNDYLNVFHTDKSDNISHTDLSSAIANILKKAKSKEMGGYAVTVIIMPPSSSHNKRSALPYGSYDLPSPDEARREMTEVLLSSPSSEPTTQVQSPNVSDLEDFPTIMSTNTQANNTSPVLGILPACFLTEDECNQKTHGCSGHGNCYLQHKGEKGKDARVRDCYACKCSATVVKVNGNIKTTEWGGPACQKKDVSVPFWLFVGSGVILAFLIASGIGLLYSMGSEELPSVIGAGVSGPTRK